MRKLVTLLLALCPVLAWAIDIEDIHIRDPFILPVDGVYYLYRSSTQDEMALADDLSKPEGQPVRLCLVIHSPNSVNERARIFELEDTGDTLILK